MKKEKTLVNEEVFTHPVKLPLTDKELLAYADELTALDAKLDEATLKFESQRNSHKSIAKDIAENQKRILNLLRVKEEFKDVDCYNDFNWFEGIVEIRRVEGGEVVTTRKITQKEYQQKLPMEDGNES